MVHSKAGIPVKLEWTRQERGAAPEAECRRAQHNLSVPTLVEQSLAQGNTQLDPDVAARVALYLDERPAYVVDAWAGAGPRG